MPTPRAMLLILSVTCLFTRKALRLIIIGAVCVPLLGISLLICVLQLLRLPGVSVPPM